LKAFWVDVPGVKLFTPHQSKINSC
jgi:hypothetical protein